MIKIGLVITSCGRWELLSRTIKSFEENNTYPLECKIIVEDSRNQAMFQKLLYIFGPDTKYGYTVIQNSQKKQVGQFYSIDRGYAICEANDCEYVFHCEDDWEFLKPGFMEQSLALLEYGKNIFSVNIREFDKDTQEINGHPIILRDGKYYFQKNFGEWDGFSLNPGLRRISDYKLCAPYGQFKAEHEISIAYKKYNFDYAVLPGYCKHIGDGQSVREY